MKSKQAMTGKEVCLIYCRLAGPHTALSFHVMTWLDLDVAASAAVDLLAGNNEISLQPRLQSTM